METGAENTRWLVIGSSVIGASHIRAGLPNQDAVGWLQKTGAGRSLIVAASDGHGSAKYFRSHVGSRLAVEAAIALGQEFLNGQPDIKNLSAIKRTAEERLPREMSRRWTEAVEAHIKSSPISAEEMDALEKKDGVAAREAIQEKPSHAYGATILIVLVEESFILYLQLGDGDILLVSDGGDVERPLPKDERLFANETTSLSSQNAWSDFRFSFQTLVGPPPALILLSTDGYANSFISDEAFLKIGKDFLDMIRADGLDKVNANLETWLSEASAAGSGDDITLAIVCRTDALSSPGHGSLADEGLPAGERSSAHIEATGKETANVETADKESADKDSSELARLPMDSSPAGPSSADPLTADGQAAPEEEKQ
ncbi:MAG TPA: PP2C family serine/threonine-protein phosphatase [Blastocatellia bacterium]|jgi:serine/threonine protein phosphatase PrpC